MDAADLSVSVNRFGDSLHVVHGDDVAPEDIAARLSDLDVTVVAVAPSIEDTFVELMAVAS